MTIRGLNEEGGRQPNNTQDVVTNFLSRTIFRNQTDNLRNPYYNGVLVQLNAANNELNLDLLMQNHQQRQI